MLLALGLSGCGGGRANSALDVSPKLSVSSLTLLRYDASTATLNLQGSITGAVVTPYTLIAIHASSACVDDAIGSGIASVFMSTGVTVQVPTTITTSLYGRTNTDNGCYLLATYSPPTGKPLPPAFTSTSPASPSAVSSTPFVIGTTAGSVTAVNLFNDAACTQVVGAGTPANFANVGIGTTLTPNQTSSIYGQTVEPLGHISDCTLLTSYRHDSTLAPPPALTSMTPMSPTNMAVSTRLVGTLDSSIATVSIYSDIACSAPLVSGQASDFKTTGLLINGSANASTLLYAKAIDTNGRASACTYLDTFTNDTIAPPAPVYANLTPGTPTRLTIYPKVTGMVSDDTVIVKLYSQATCLTEIGSGSRADFVGIGITASGQLNATVQIYAKAFDPAGNGSSCTPMISFTNNTIPPDPPQFFSTIPASPNNRSITPKVSGSLSTSAAVVNFYSDSICTLGIGSGSANDYLNAGVTITVTGNTTTSVYATAVDAIGNVSSCTLLTDYSHSTVAAPAPVYARTVPASPSKSSLTPSVQGTVGARVVDVGLFSDSACTTAVGSGRASDFIGSGVQASVNANATTSIWAVATDVYGNQSSCTYMNAYTHDNIAPALPVFASVSPLSPTRASSSPTLLGTASVDTSKVFFYDDDTCSSALANYTRTEFVLTGAVVDLARNATTNIYAKAFDLAGNGTACTFLTSFTHDNLPPGMPTLTSATPMTPSYSNHVTFVGQIATSTDFLPVQKVDLYSDSLCSAPLTTGASTSWSTPGFTVDLPMNTTTTVYAQSTDTVGNQSACNHLIDYNHNDHGPSNVYASQTPNGSVNLTWLSDINANAYVVKRSTTMGGPYTIISPYVVGPSFNDTMVNDNTTYFYVVASTNVTGLSKDSSEVSIALSIGAPPAPASLTAVASAGQVDLSWSAFGNQAMTYLVYRATQSGGPYALIGSRVPSTSYTNTGLTNGTNYYFVVRSSNPHGYSGYSNEARVRPLNVPPPPANLSGHYVGGQGYVLTWSAPSYYTDFKVKRGSSTGALSAIGTVNGNTYTFTDTGPGPGQSGNYQPNYYTVTASFGSSDSPDSNIVKFCNSYGPSLSAATGNNEVALSWSYSYNVDGYNVYRASTPSETPTLIASGVTSTSFTDSTAVNGSTYYYTTTLIATGSSCESIPGNQVVATPSALPTQGPTNLTVTNFAGNTSLLRWSTPSKYDWFKVYRASAASGPWTTLNTASGASYNDSPTPVGISYYRVSSIWASGETGTSNVVAYRNGTTASLVATANATSLTLSWSVVSGASSYEIFRSTNYNDSYVDVGSSASSPFVDAGAVAGQGYYYKIAANFADGSRGQPSNIIASMWSAATTVSGLTITQTTTSSLSLQWAPVIGATTYKIYQATASGGPYTYRANSSTPTAVVVGLSAYSKNYFIVRAVKGTTEYDPSNEVSAVTALAASAPTVIPGNSVVDVSWGVSTNASSYQLLRSTDGLNFTQVASGLTSTTFSDTSVTNGVLYFYEIMPTYAGVNTIFASGASAGVTPGVVPDAPTGLTITGNASGSDLTLSWTAQTAATSYNIKQASNSSGPYTTLGNVSTNSGNVISGLTSGTAYYFKVSALIGTVEGANSVSVGAVVMSQPTAPTATIVNNTSVLVNWSAVSCGGANAASYDLLRSINDADYSVLASGVSGTSFSDTSFTSGLSYSYQLIPNCSGGLQGSRSPASSPHVTPGIAPLMPQGLVAYSLTGTSVVLSWIDTPTAAKYNVYRSPTSGGPYSLISSPTSSTFTDSTVGVGTYYYVISAVGPVGMESSKSTEAGISLALSAPSGFVAVGGQNQVSLSWATVVAASSYKVYRSVASGGPYGLLQLGVTATSFVDTTAAAGQTYYYTVVSVASSGVQSGFSSEVSATVAAALNLQVSIEVIDSPLGSNTTAQTFARSQTSLDTTAYDGTVGYRFEVVATNSGTLPATITLNDSTDTAVATASIPAGTSQPQRKRVTFIPNNGSQIYRLHLPATAAPGDLQVSTVRILVQQTGATKTKLYIPMLGAVNAPATTDFASPIFSTSDTTFTQLPTAAMYRREVTKLLQINDYNAWELDAVVSASGGATGAFALINTTLNSTLNGTETLVSNAAPTLLTVPFNEGMTNFAKVNEGNLYETSLRCYEGCVNGAVAVYKAGLWVSLHDLSKVQVISRLSLGAPVLLSQSTFDGSRSYYDATKYTNPSVALQASGASSGGAISIQLSQSALDQGTSDLAAISGAVVNISTIAKSLTRTSFTSPTGVGLVPTVDPGSNAATFGGTFLIIETN